MYIIKYYINYKLVGKKINCRKDRGLHRNSIILRSFKCRYSVFASLHKGVRVYVIKSDSLETFLFPPFIFFPFWTCTVVYFELEYACERVIDLLVIQ